MTSRPASYRGYRFPLEIISQAVWLYYRFGLSVRDVEDLLEGLSSAVTNLRSRPLPRGRGSGWTSQSGRGKNRSARVQ